MKRGTERQIFPHILQQHTCIYLYAGLNLYIIKGGNDTLLLLDTEFVAFHQYQHVYITVRAGVSPSLTSIQDSLRIGSNLRQCFLYPFYNLRAFHLILFYVWDKYSEKQ